MESVVSSTIAPNPHNPHDSSRRTDSIAVLCIPRLASIRGLEKLGAKADTVATALRRPMLSTSGPVLPNHPAWPFQCLKTQLASRIRTEELDVSDRAVQQRVYTTLR